MLPLKSVAESTPEAELVNILEPAPHGFAGYVGVLNSLSGGLKVIENDPLVNVFDARLVSVNVPVVVPPDNASLNDIASVGAASARTSRLVVI